ncbi:MAG TPA: efflux RND transporter periplasmic adaptor subunit, partial [Candidatus Eremiobacteraceae bacterium]|nr:efflux RND transporter periplasmic adaptor subunit [Candidatus Eremiobacteraceae bacterium]
MKRSWIIVAGVAALIIILILIGRAVSSKGAAPRYLTATVGYTDLNATIQETGTVIPVNEVDVGTQVSGTIATLDVDYNSIVKKGQVLATLDPTSFQAASDQAHATLDAAQATAQAADSTATQQQDALAAAVANVNSAQANLAKANAQEVYSHATVTRDQSLIASGYIPQSQLDSDVAADKANIADVVAAKAALVTAQAQVAVAQAQHAAAESQAGAAQAQASASAGQAQQADYNLDHAVITSPIDGIVVSRAVSVGTTVAASFETPTLFVIATNLKDMEVDASVSEADVGSLHDGASAQITVPAYPN